MNEKPEVDKRVIVSTEKLIKKAAFIYRTKEENLTAPNLTSFAKLLDSYRGLIERASEDDLEGGFYDDDGMPMMFTKAQEERLIKEGKLKRKRRE